jgi:hypothetical protein
MSKKLTPWFPGHVKPAHIGFYERDYHIVEAELADYWDGDDWWVVPNGCPEERYLGAPVCPWRGLAEKP